MTGRVIACKMAFVGALLTAVTLASITMGSTPDDPPRFAIATVRVVYGPAPGMRSNRAVVQSSSPKATRRGVDLLRVGRAHFIHGNGFFLGVGGGMGVEEGKEDVMQIAGAEYVHLGKATLWGHTFESDAAYPLTFKLTERDGYVRLCGRGTVSGPDGAVYRLGYGETVEFWLPRLKSSDELEREGAAQALGWLCGKTDSGRDKALRALTEALRDKSLDVRRDAAKALGRIGDMQAMAALQRLAAKDGDDDRLDHSREAAGWDVAVARESVELIRLEDAASQLPDGPALAVLVGGLKHKYRLVVGTASRLLVKAGSQVVSSVAALLKDPDPYVRARAAAVLAGIADKSAAQYLREALSDEKDASTKKAIEKALEQVEE